MNTIHRTFLYLFAVAALAGLSFIGYNTGLGKTLPMRHPRWLSCNGLLSQQLFYNEFLGQNSSTKTLAANVLSAPTTSAIVKMVTAGSNINAGETEWFKALHHPDNCQAEIFLENPRSDGKNAAYVHFSMQGYLPVKTHGSAALNEGDVLEEVGINFSDIQWITAN